MGDGVALVRRVLAEAATPPRWPMYPRQFKQFLKNAAPEFDERKHGAINDLMRASQKDGLVRLERDRQGGLRVFSAGAGGRASAAHGWGRGDRDHDGNTNGHGADADGSERSAFAPENSAELRRIEPAVAEPVIDAAIISGQSTRSAEATEGGEGGPQRKAKRARKTATTTEKVEKKKAAPRKKKSL